MTDFGNRATSLVAPEAVLGRFGVLTPPAPLPDWKNAIAFRWRKNHSQGWLQAVPKRIQFRPADGTILMTRKNELYQYLAICLPATWPTMFC